MFSGIVEEIGRVKEIAGGTKEISVYAKMTLHGTKEGDSISVNGVCLTVTGCGKDSLTFGLLQETIDRTNIGRAGKGSRVNMERALEFGKRVGGHFVTGHVDGIGRVINVDRIGTRSDITVRVPEHVMHLISKLGSICIDGVSLTVFGVERDGVKLSLTPFTLGGTIAGDYVPGSLVNIEADILARYVERGLSRKKEQGVTNGFLREHGYVKNEDLTP